MSKMLSEISQFFSSSVIYFVHGIKLHSLKYPLTSASIVSCGQPAFFSLSLGREKKRVWSSSNATIILTHHVVMSQVCSIYAPMRLNSTVIKLP